MNAIDSIIAPTRSKFIGAASRVIHNSGRYNACVVSVGLVIQSHRTGSGVCMAPDHPQYASYVDAIENAFDSDDADALCKALL
jgi:hypothetical protein